MSDKKRFNKPGSLQPNIEDILQWNDLPADAFDPATSEEKENFIQDRRSVSYWKDAWRRLRKNTVAMVALVIIILLSVFAFVGPSVVPYTYKQQIRGSESLHPWHYSLEDQDKINAYMTLYTALVTVSKAAAPMIPFMTEEIYQNLVRSVDQNAPESIHLCMFPEVNEDQIDTELEQNMEHVLKLVVMGRACRNTSNIKNRQPIGQMFVKAAFDLPEFYQDIVADELNVKNVKFTDDVRDFTSYSFKPQLKTVGPKYGKMLGGIKAALNDIDGNAAMDELNATGALKLDVNGQEIELFKEDLLIDTAQIEGYESVNDNGITVVLDTNLSPELLEEGFVREIISKIQTMRKEADFEVMDRIKVTYEGSEKAEAVFEKNNTLIAGEVLADEVVKAQPAGYVKEWKINGEVVTMGVEKKGE